MLSIFKAFTYHLDFRHIGGARAWCGIRVNIDRQWLNQCESPCVRNYFLLSLEKLFFSFFSSFFAQLWRDTLYFSHFFVILCSTKKELSLPNCVLSFYSVKGKTTNHMKQTYFMIQISIIMLLHTVIQESWAEITKNWNWTKSVAQTMVQRGNGHAQCEGSSVRQWPLLELAKKTWFSPKPIWINMNRYIMQAWKTYNVSIRLHRHIQGKKLAYKYCHKTCAVGTARKQRARPIFIENKLRYLGLLGWASHRILAACQSKVMPSQSTNSSDAPGSSNSQRIHQNPRKCHREKLFQIFYQIIQLLLAPVT